MSEWHPTEYTLRQMEQQTKKLIDNFDQYLTKFNNAFLNDETFGGPSLYFHYQAISQFTKLSVSEKLRNDRFIEYIYAVLVSWGMHRMGNDPTKLGSFSEFKQAIRSQEEILSTLADYRIWLLMPEDIAKIIPALQIILDTMRISKSKSHLVANTKVLHHILPNLLPPVDRSYTLAFFGISTMLPSQKPAGSIFKHLYPAFITIAKGVSNKINRVVDLSFENWHTSFTKVIDNAIIGAMIE